MPLWKGHQARQAIANGSLRATRRDEPQGRRGRRGWCCLQEQEEQSQARDQRPKDVASIVWPPDCEVSYSKVEATFCCQRGSSVAKRMTSRTRLSSTMDHGPPWRNSSFWRRKITFRNRQPSPKHSEAAGKPSIFDIQIWIAAHITRAEARSEPKRKHFVSNAHTRSK